MSTNTYLGSPADYVRFWEVKNLNLQNTYVTYTNGTKRTFDIQGILSDIDNKLSIKLAVIGSSVTYIHDYCFDSATRMKYVSIGNSVQTIGGEAFRYCESLTSITIPDSVTSIGNNAFYECTSLASITLGNQLSSIGAYAFSGCDEVTSITIPASVTSIGDKALDIEKLKYLTVDSNNQNYTANNNLLLSKDGTTLIFCPVGLTGVITVPSSVTSIGKGAFQGMQLITNVIIPISVTSIGNFAFWHCSLTSVTIPSSVTSIGSSALGNNQSLANVTMQGKTMAEVQAMDNYSWGLNSGCVIHCSDGDITI